MSPTTKKYVIGILGAAVIGGASYASVNAASSGLASNWIAIIPTVIGVILHYLPSSSSGTLSTSAQKTNG